MKILIRGLMVAVLVLSAAFSWSQTAGSGSLGLLVEADQLEAARQDPLANLLVIDFGRTRADYERAHVPGAVYLARSAVLEKRDGVPNMLPDPDTLVATLRAVGLSNSAQVVIYDQNNGRRAARLFWTLEYLGHERVGLLNGGFDRWLAAGLPVRSGKEPVKTGGFTPSPRPETLAELSWIRENIDQPRITLVDARSLGEYTGTVRRARRNGHIPGAVRIEWSEDLNPDNTFLDRDELERLYQPVGGKDREVVAYCQTGQRASHTYFVLRLLGYRNVRLYDASWAEWGNREDTPVTAGGEPR